MKRLLCAAIFLTLIPAHAAIAQQAPAPPAGKPAAAGTSKESSSAGSIKGRVIDEAGRAVAGAYVIALAANAADNPTEALASLFNSATTDSDGKFEFKDLTPKIYFLWTIAPGYVQTGASEPKFYRVGDTATISMMKGGVITGRVTTSAGDPVVGVGIRTVRLRDGAGQATPVSMNFFSYMFMSIPSALGSWKTDDRGIYRIYGLEPGKYHVAAGGKSLIELSEGGYNDDVPTYYPSASTPDAAVEVAVQAGQEMSNIDIRYRSERGFSISGTVSGDAASNRGGLLVYLMRAQGGAVEAISPVPLPNSERTFRFEPVPEGDYQLMAMVVTERGRNKISQPRSVTVRGADVEGVELALAPLSSISGSVVIKPAQEEKIKADCKNRRAGSLEEIVILARADKKDVPKNEPPAFLTSYLSNDTAGVPNDKGRFTIGNLLSGAYHFDVELPGERWYASAISQPAPGPKARAIDLARDSLKLKSGDEIKNILITVSEGAASLKGRVVPSEEGKTLPPRMRVYLVPEEKESAEDVLRYREVEIDGSGAFELNHLAPGRYLVLARPVADEELSQDNPRPVSRDASGRMGLRFEGEVINTVVELKPCQSVGDYVFRYTPPVAPTAPVKKISRQPSAVSRQIFNHR
ncbi:MAG: carboxypeptidase-like regulatory domain-containing protein [Blastocatellia bacterium]|nr:carboxypeptidase-like regulatory domain-containing protein [Blastocatellia bacterium]